MQKEKIRKKFHFSNLKFVAMTEEEQLQFIHEFPAKCLREYESRYAIVEDLIADGFGGKGRFDVTANAAINHMEFLEMSEKNLQNLFQMEDDEEMPIEYLALMQLGHSLKLYEKVIKRFPEDITEVLWHRLNGESIEEIYTVLDKSKSYVTCRITESNEKFEEKVKEALLMRAAVAKRIGGNQDE